MKTILLILSAITVLLLYVLILATGNGSALSDYYWWFLGFNILLLLSLSSVVFRQLLLLYRDHRNRIFGAKITRRLVVMFAIVAVVPGLFIFAVSAQFISQSINSWFGDETTEALERGVQLSQTTLDTTLKQVAKKSKSVEIKLIENYVQYGDISQALNALQSKEIEQFSQVDVYRLPDWNKEASIGLTSDEQVALDNEDEQELMKQGSWQNTQSINGKLFSTVWIYIPENTLGVPQNYVMFFRQPVPENIANDVTLIENAREKYAQLMYAKTGLQTFFIMTLVMATFLAILLSLIVAVYFARKFVAPLASLAEGTRAVAQGDFSQKSPVFRSDEMGMLSSLFNRMTEQLQVAQNAAEEHRQKLEAQRHYLERVLSSLTTGVLTFDADGVLKTSNQSAENILGVSLAEKVNEPWKNWVNISPQWAAVAQVIEQALETTDEDPIELDYVGVDVSQIIWAKSVPLPNNSGQGFIMIFDDVTDLVRAQKDAAWGEVAKRLAHEIRNPLTPIQLSAERLAWKLADKLPSDDDRGILTRSTDTIVKQVQALKEMVEAFRNYARSPSLKLVKIDLNQLVGEVLTLYEGSGCHFQNNLSNISLPVHVDTSMMRQVMHNIFKNAAEAAEIDSMPTVTIQTEIQDGLACLTVCNNGKGFSPHVLAHAFEPYVTDKKNGTGLGLAVVKKIVDEHQGRIVLSNHDSGGAQVQIALPIMET